MKFLCPQCKAKYRIADEKLAQRATSRMKCRKCGHVIDIHAATVPESIRAPDALLDDEDDDEPAPPPRQGTPRVAPVGSGTAAAPRGVPAPAKRPVVAPPKRVGAPPRRGSAVAVAKAVVQKPLPSDEDERAVATNPIGAPKPEPAPLAKAGFEDEAPTRIHDGAALTAAFSLAAGDGAALATPSPADEWYVGIDGSPVGPIGIAALRDKAKLGKATLDSLVWREGFEEWKPLRDFPELAAFVEEAKRDAPAEDPRTLPAPAALEQAKHKGSGVSQTPSELLEEMGLKPQKAVSHPAAWIAVVVALALGVTIGAVLLSKTEKQEVVKYVEVPASARPDPGQVGGDNTQTIQESTVSGGGTKKPGVPGAKVEPNPVPSAKGLATLNGLNGLNGLGPAAAQGPDVSQGSAPGGQLDGNSIQRVVANFRESVRRGCWDPALSGRAPDAPSSARVGVTITISGSGSVDDVSTTGDPKGYPNLAHCIESKVRGWRFPRSSGTTTAQVPFVFAAQ